MRQLNKREIGCTEKMNMMIGTYFRGLDRGANHVGGLSRRGLHRGLGDRDSFVLVGQSAQALTGVRVPHVDQTIAECRTKCAACVVKVVLPRAREHMAVALNHQTLETVE